MDRNWCTYNKEIIPLLFIKRKGDKQISLATRRKTNNLTGYYAQICCFFWKYGG